MAKTKQAEPEPLPWHVIEARVADHVAGTCQKPCPLCGRHELATHAFDQVAGRVTLRCVHCGFMPVLAANKIAGLSCPSAAFLAGDPLALLPSEALDFAQYVGGELEIHYVGEGQRRRFSMSTDEAASFAKATSREQWLRQWRKGAAAGESGSQW
jgi:hypothetical protein